MGLLAGVVDLEGEDGEAVDDEAGSLGVEGRRRVLGGSGGEEQSVDLLDEVVAPLVEAVDGVLDAGDLGVGGGGVAGLVFLVPEVEVGAVVAQDEAGEGKSRDRVASRTGRAGLDASPRWSRRAGESSFERSAWFEKGSSKAGSHVSLSKSNDLLRT